MRRVGSAGGTCTAVGCGGQQRAMQMESQAVNICRSWCLGLRIPRDRHLKQEEGGARERPQHRDQEGQRLMERFETLADNHRPQPIDPRGRARDAAGETRNGLCNADLLSFSRRATHAALCA